MAAPAIGRIAALDAMLSAEPSIRYFDPVDG